MNRQITSRDVTADSCSRVIEAWCIYVIEASRNTEGSGNFQCNNTSYEVIP